MAAAVIPSTNQPNRIRHEMTQKTMADADIVKAHSHIQVDTKLAFTILTVSTVSNKTTVPALWPKLDFCCSLKHERGTETVFHLLYVIILRSHNHTL